MIIHPIFLETAGHHFYTHHAVIDFNDLVALGANLTGTIDLYTAAARDLVTAAAFELETPFDGGATSSLTLDLGWTVDSADADGLLDAYEIHLDGTEILAGDANGAAFATLRTGKAFQAAGVVQALFTVVGANLNTLTTGKVHVYFAVHRLPDLR